jgi:tetratricopeptide (TPR) repeat protein
MTANMNIGARHLLPIYPFLYILGAGAAWVLIRRHRVWLVPVVALVVWQAIDSVYMYPAYMAFGNDLWGGPPAVHKYLSDANVDWGQQLNDVRTYLRAHNIQSCWFAYFPDGVVHPAAYGIPCHRLPTANTLWWMHDPTPLPTSIDGIVLISDSDLEGIEFGEGPLNPYEQFRDLCPMAVIDYGIDIYVGHFDIPLAAALNDAEVANQLLKQNQPDQALAEAQLAVALAPDLVNPEVALGDALTALHRSAEARACYQKALNLAQTIEPELQTGWVHDLKAKLAEH